jgi:hypothetical protein
MIPGMLIQVNPYKYMTAYYKLLTPEDYMQQMQDRKLKSVRENTLALEPGMVLLYVEDVYWIEQLWCKLLLNDRICYLHGSLVNLTNFRTLDAPMFEAM